MSNFSRRRFLQSSAAVSSLTILPSGLLAAKPNSKLNIAFVGVGGKGHSDRMQIIGHKLVNVIALCDTDNKSLAKAASGHRSAKTYSDYRVMFDEIGEQLDGICISTPDHMHAPIAMTAINYGVHIYCQKPLCHTVDETRRITEAASEKKLVTQMGIQIHSHVAYRMAVQMIQDGAIGKVKEVHSWSGKMWGYTGALPKGSDAVPTNLDWNLWQGAATARPYKAGIFAEGGNWRKWYEYGCGTMGDMSVHILDPVIGSLELKNPTSITSFSPEPQAQSFSLTNKVEYTFNKTPYTDGSMKLTWYDGNAKPDTRGWEMPRSGKLPSQGSMFIGTEGFMLLPHIGAPQLLPKQNFKGFKRPKLKTNNHYTQWVDCIVDPSKQPSANFDYSGPYTEVVLLGVLANRFPTQKLIWDSEELRFTNFNEANKLVKLTPRKGWETPGL